MSTLMIADDEPKIQRGLKKAVESMNLGVEIVALAQDGPQALSYAKQLRPDIILMDIEMPYIGGLEVVETLQSQGNESLFVIISGHDEFQLAQKAVKLRVLEYLLKPVQEVQLESVLRRAIEELDFKKKSEEYQRKAKEYLIKNRSVILEGLFRDWLEGRLTCQEVLVDFQALNIPQLTNPRLALLRIDQGSYVLEKDKFGSSRFFKTTLKAMAAEAFETLNTIVFENIQGDIVLVSDSADMEAYSRSLDKIVYRITNLTGHTPLSYQAPVPGGIENLSNVYDDLLNDSIQQARLDPLVIAAINYLEKNYWNPLLSLDILAMELSLSPNYLSRILRQATGYGFVDFLNRLRVQKAVVFMSDPGSKMFEIAEKVGYQSQHYFSRAFRKVYGTTPSEFKKGGE